MAAAAPPASERATSSPLQEALRFARRGLAVHPLLGKVPPEGTRGFHDAATDEDVLRRWWRRWPEANFGIRTGQRLPSGGYLLVLDEDPRHGGDYSIARWEAEHGPLPETFTVETGGGGRHRYYWTEDPLGCRTDLLPGVDVKAEGGYVVGPGSVHPGDEKHGIPWGGLYRISLRAPVAPLPEVLVQLVQRAPTWSEAGERQVGEQFTEGRRNAMLASLAGSMRRRGMSEGAIRAALLEENVVRCEPRLEEAEVARIAASVGKYPPEVIEPPRPLMRELPPADPYPLEALGSLLAGAARAIQDRIQAPEAICGQSVLAAAALAAQAHANVVLPTGAARPLSLYLATVAQSGERKSAADNIAKEPLNQWEAARREEHRPAYLRWRNEHEVWQQERKRVLAGQQGSAAGRHLALDALGPEPLAPPLPLLTCPEPTFEGLCRLLAEAHPSVGVFAGEGGQFVGGHGMNPENRLRTAAGLCSLWDGEPVRRVRAGDGVSVLPGRRVAMHLMLQPGVAAELLADPVLLDQGLLSRLLVTAPESNAGGRFWREPSPGSDVALARYAARLLEMLRTPLPLVDGTRNELNPRPLPLSPAAYHAWTAYADHLEVQLGPGGSLEAIRGLANKLPEQAARIAGVLALVEDLTASDVTGDHLEAGIALADHYAAEALRLFEVSRSDERLRHAATLLHWLLHDRSDGMVSLPDIYQYGPNRIRSAREARLLVGILEEHGWLVRVEGGAEVAGTRRRDVWLIRRSE
jgi:hypothetical protein